MKVDLAAGTVSGEVDHFTKFAVLATEKATQAPPVTFKDIAGHWAKEAIEFMAAKGFLKGYPDGACRPDQPVTRAEFTALLVRVLSLPEAAEETFADVLPGAWHYRVIASAVHNGLVKGYSKNQFGPDDPVTREQVAALITRALTAKGISAELNEAQTAELPGRFSDAGEISAWAKTAAAAAVHQGLVSGYPDGTFGPQKTSTRAECATMLKRLSEK
ncbi:MAG TPA: hypothetical protein DCK76_08505 [Desulfotomaculum sp.]|nr:MAG: S-layer domain protein [Desulfotomaculum sp. 46_80]HAG11403.1 hypothetical protein [Desulfotomaculum sp.]HBY05171.1 hypothetical protein [Desulfotomaculum sp.]